MSDHESLHPVRVIDRRRAYLAPDGSWEMVGSECTVCGEVSHPLHALCPECGGGSVPVTLSRKGRVVASTVVRRARKGLAMEPPFQVVLIRLLDGPLLRVPSRSPLAFVAGEAVELRGLVVDIENVPTLAFQASRPGGAA